MSKHRIFHGHKNQAYELIDKVKEMGFQLSVPIDIKALLNFLEIRYDIKPDFKKVKVTGSISVQNGEPYIWVNPMKNTTRERRRFTLAHELGHFMLHIAPLDDFNSFQEIEDQNISFNRNDNWDYKEMEANNFAAQLLMPAKLVEEQVQLLIEKAPTKEDVIAQLAKHFTVSVQVMEYRLKRFGVRI